MKEHPCPIDVSMIYAFAAAVNSNFAFFGKQLQAKLCQKVLLFCRISKAGYGKLISAKSGADVRLGNFAARKSCCFCCFDEGAEPTFSEFLLERFMLEGCLCQKA